MRTSRRPFGARLTAYAAATLTALAGAVLIASPATASPTDVKIGGVIYTYDPAVSTTDVKVTGYTPASGQTAVTIRASLDFGGSPKPVSVIADGVFENFPLTSVTFLGTNLAAIGDNAFMNTDLPKVKLPAGLQVIGTKAFFGNKLATLTVPHAVTVIGEAAFELNFSLKSLTLGNHVTVIGEQAFQATDLQQVTIPNSVAVIGAEAFIESSLKSVVIGDQVAVIGDNAFDDQSGPLKSVRFLGTPPSSIGTGNTVDESFNTSGAYPLVTYPAAFAAPGYPDGFTKPTWRGYNSASVATSTSGAAREGHTLSAHPRATPGLTYQWLADGKPISGAVADKLKLRKAQAGHRIQVAITNPGARRSVSARSRVVSSPYKRLVLSATSVKRGQRLRVTATGFRADQKVRIRLDNVTRWSGRVDSYGVINRSVTFRSDTRAGRRSVKVQYKRHGAWHTGIRTSVRYYR